MNGSSTITLTNSSMQFESVTMLDSSATSKTHGINLIQTAAALNLQVRNSKFDASSYFDNVLSSINGSYIHAEGGDQIGINITQTTFRTGSSKFGGAIYLNNVNKLSLFFEDTSFENCKADWSGGALYLGEMDSYSV